MRRFLSIAIACALSGVFTSLHAQAPASGASAAPPTPNDYTQDAAWLCRPGGHDACAVDLTTTVVAADGTLTREPWSVRPDAAIDCFYVYPTVSTDPGEYSDMTPDPAERNVIAQQFARFAAVCRPFAPLYRQVTLVGLRKRLSGPLMDLGTGLAYLDVRDAWRDYLKRDNGGRGVVLIGHSQGSFILIELLRQEIEGMLVQKQIVSAILMGTTVWRRRDRGPAARSRRWRRATRPGPRLYHHLLDVSRDRAAACQRPLRPRDGTQSGGALHQSRDLQRAIRRAPRLSLGSGRDHYHPADTAPWAAGKTIETPWVSVPGLLTARCASNDHASYLEVTVNGNPADPRADDIAGDIGLPGKPLADWGLHLVDVNLAMGNLLAIVGQQAKAWTSRRP